MRNQAVEIDEIGSNHIALPLETFWILSPNGKQLEIPHDPPLANQICRQTVEGMDFLHSRGICHGDFRPQNILMRLKGAGLNHIGRDKMYDMLEKPGMAEVLTGDGKHSLNAPRHLVSGIK
ncbi:Uu.00g141560.m01.CDS01 [Anthostomella pinea]|uniref:EKC/KEOPS complex subunit BUD32 n=1 Tax=Anthostomella pinea TaxID=933095 RepID=A0AAI8VJU7_9PEZI|nr:Uu.00g141560.m01.CDS01 [Anthostomella pinea]